MCVLYIFVDCEMFGCVVDNDGIVDGVGGEESGGWSVGGWGYGEGFDVVGLGLEGGEDYVVGGWVSVGFIGVIVVVGLWLGLCWGGEVWERDDFDGIVGFVNGDLIVFGVDNDGV